MGEDPGNREEPAEKEARPTSGGLSTSSKIALLLLVLTILVVTATHFAIRDTNRNAEAMRQGTSPASGQTSPR